MGRNLTDREIARRRAICARAGRPWNPDDWIPNEGPQTQFLQLTCREALYGGAAGGGKSDSLLIDAIRYVGRGYGRNYSALLLRRTFPELEESLIKRSHDIYPLLGGVFKASPIPKWTFPQGETVRFGHIQHEKNVEDYRSAEYQFIGFDEVTHFTEYQYLYLFSRCRSSHGIPTRIRAGTNPGGPGHEWVFKRWGAWLDPDSELQAAPGEVLYFVRNEDTDEDEAVDASHPLAISRTFIPAKVSDNPMIGHDYVQNLQNLQKVERMQLRDGNWLVKPSKGMYFKRTWFGDPVEAAPVNATRIRYWDRAATGETEEEKRKRAERATDDKGPDWTVGLLLAKAESIYYVEDVIRFRGNPGEVKRTIKQTAHLDGKDVLVGLEEDPGQAGKFEIAEYKTYLDGFTVKAFPARQDKIVRAGPASTQCEAGNMKIVKGPWNKAFLSETEEFPEGSHDDQVDALSGAHNAISKGVAPPHKPKLPQPRSSVWGDGAAGW